MKSKWWIIMVVLVLTLLVCNACSDSSNYEYDRDDKYYSQNDRDNDGKINGNEFHGAVDDWMSDHGY